MSDVFSVAYDVLGRLLDISANTRALPLEALGRGHPLAGKAAALCGELLALDHAGRISILDTARDDAKAGLLAVMPFVVPPPGLTREQWAMHAVEVVENLHGFTLVLLAQFHVAASGNVLDGWESKVEKAAGIVLRLIEDLRRMRAIAVVVDKPADHTVVDKPVVASKPGKRIPTNDRMKVVLVENPESRNWTIQQWRIHLKCAPSTIQGTPMWDTLHAAHVVAKINRMEAQKRQRGLDKKGIDRRGIGRNID